MPRHCTYNQASAIYNVKRAVTLKEDLPELWFLCAARLLKVFYVCERFHENILNSFQLTIHGGNGYVQCSKDNNSKSRQTRVTVHVFGTLPHGALYLCEVP